MITFLLVRLHLLLANGVPQVVNPVHDLLDGDVRGFERGNHLGLAHFFRPGLHHHNAVARAGDDQVQEAGLPLPVGRVDYVFTVNEADAHPRGGLRDGNPRERQRGGRTGNREHVGVIVRISREQERDDLRLVSPPPARTADGSADRFSRLVSTSLSDGLPSRLKNPPGMRPEAYVYSR